MGVKEFDKLPNDLKIKHNTYLSMFGAVSAMTKAGKVKLLESAVEKAHAQLPLARTLEVFRS